MQLCLCFLPRTNFKSPIVKGIIRMTGYTSHFGASMTSCYVISAMLIHRYKRFRKMEDKNLLQAEDNTFRYYIATALLFISFGKFGDALLSNNNAFTSNVGYQN